MGDFVLKSPFSPTGDQPRAIEALARGIQGGQKAQVLMGVTGSGKTFTMAHLIAQVAKPTLVLSHNKTLAAQLYGEFSQFFPSNAVEYFISYYDYYQPEAYVPSSDLYIEKDLSINKEIERLRLRTTSSLLSSRQDVIVVASVSCIYGLGNPDTFRTHAVHLKIGDEWDLRAFMHRLVELLYVRSDGDFRHGTFRLKGDTLDIFLAYADIAYRVIFFGNQIEALYAIDPHTGQRLRSESRITIYAANLFVASREDIPRIIDEIKHDLKAQEKVFLRAGDTVAAERLVQRVHYDIEMLQSFGYCNGIENYSRYFDKRQPGERPFCLLDYFPDDYLLIIDESHVTMPQLRGMWRGDRARKMNLVAYGFRLPAALDNRPLTFQEFETLTHQVVYVSATPADYELLQTEGVVVEQIIRPTGLLDPKVDVRQCAHPMDDLLGSLKTRIARQERILITTLTKRMSEELTRFLSNRHIRCQYMHSDITALDRVQILRALRMGEFDVLVGVNLLREGLDLPEVSLVVILDADKEGFLRNERSLIQTMGRAARHKNGTVVLYAQKITPSMQAAMDETHRRRSIQMKYNQQHGITPKGIVKSAQEVLEQTGVADEKPSTKRYATRANAPKDPILNALGAEGVKKQMEIIYRQMKQAAKKEEFETAAHLRDQWQALTDWIAANQS